jgi:hypothetical protein
MKLDGLLADFRGRRTNRVLRAAAGVYSFYRLVGSRRLPRGGKQRNAGRKSGDAWKSKRVGIRPAARVAIRRALEGDENPVEILLRIARDETVAVDTRVVAAAHAAPFMFPKLSAAVVTTNVNVAKIDPRELIDRLAERIGRLAPPAAVTIDADEAAA